MKPIRLVTWLMGLCLSLSILGCTSKPAVSVDPSAEPVAVPQDSLRAKFTLTMVVDGNNQNFDAVMFSVPEKRYRMELMGPLGIGVAQLLWQESGWQIVFPTEKKYLSGAGYMVGLWDDETIPMIPIHQVAALFEGKLVPAPYTEDSSADSAGVKVVKATAGNGMKFSFGTRDGVTEWYSRGGRDGKPETLRFYDFKEFEGVKMPSKIVFERDGQMFLQIQVKSVKHGKPFGSGVWRLNIPKSYSPIGG